MSHHRDEIKDTLISLGTYSQSLTSKGAGLFEVADFDAQHSDFLCIVASVASDRATSESQVRQHLGQETVDWIFREEVFGSLVIAHQKLNPLSDHRAPVVYAGNAVESFLTQVGNHYGVSLSTATGINAKVDMLQSHIRTKHRNILKYLGHVRNAADHGIDAEIGSSWAVSGETSCIYVHAAIAAIRSVVLALLQNRYEL